MDKIQGYGFQTYTQGQRPKISPAEAHKSFAQHVSQAIDTLNTSQLKSESSIDRLVTGEAKNLHNVMVNLQKAELTLQTAIEVRNKAVKAYQEVMRMQI